MFGMHDVSRVVGSGYNCAGCGQWVASGTFHSCSGGGPKLDMSPQIWAELKRLADAAERIARALEKE